MRLASPAWGADLWITHRPQLRRTGRDCRRQTGPLVARVGARRGHAGLFGWGDRSEIRATVAQHIGALCSRGLPIRRRTGTRPAAERSCRRCSRREHPPGARTSCRCHLLACISDLHRGGWSQDITDDGQSAKDQRNACRKTCRKRGDGSDRAQRRGLTGREAAPVAKRASDRAVHSETPAGRGKCRLSGDRVVPKSRVPPCLPLNPCAFIQCRRDVVQMPCATSRQPKKRAP